MSVVTLTLNPSVDLATSVDRVVGVASGSLPPGVPDEAYVEVTRAARARGAQVVLAVEAGGMHLIKPNLRKLGQLAGCEQLDEDLRAAAGHRLKVVILSLIWWGYILRTAGTLLAVPVTMSLRILFENTEDLRWLAALLESEPS